MHTSAPCFSERQCPSSNQPTTANFIAVHRVNLILFLFVYFEVSRCQAVSWKPYERNQFNGKRLTFRFAFPLDSLSLGYYGDIFSFCCGEFCILHNNQQGIHKLAKFCSTHIDLLIQCAICIYSLSSDRMNVHGWNCCMAHIAPRHTHECEIWQRKCVCVCKT